MGVAAMEHKLWSAEPRFHRTVWFKCVVMAAVALTTVPLLSLLDLRLPPPATTSTSRDIVSSVRNHSAAAQNTPGAPEQHPPSRSSSADPSKHGLRFDWSNLSPTTTLGRAMQAHQSDCSLPLGDLRMRNQNGLGSDLHMWTQALCNGMQDNVRVQTLPPWIYRDAGACSDHSQETAMLCYFPYSELRCPDDRASLRTTAKRMRLYRGGGMVVK